jgi:hypothetical protein
LIITLTDPNNNPRPYKQIIHYLGKHEITVLGQKKVLFDTVESIENRYKISYLNLLVVWFFNLLRFYDISNKVFSKPGSLYRFQNILKSREFDLIITHDIETLPFAVSIKNNSKLLFDAHEYFPEEYNDFLINWIFKKYRIALFKKYVPQIDFMITVSEGIANKYLENFGVSSAVITNTSEFITLKPTKVDPDNIKLIHHGIASPSRQIEKMIEVMKYTEPRYYLYLMLMPTSPNYLIKLKRIAKDLPNVYFLNPVPMNQIVKTINQFDIGLYILEPNSTNNLLALPNKFFEFVQARLAIAVSPSPEMAKIVQKYNIGIVANDFSPKEMAWQLNNLSAERIQNYKIQSHQSAYELSAESNFLKLDRYLNLQ